MGSVGELKEPNLHCALFAETQLSVMATWGDVTDKISGLLANSEVAFLDLHVSCFKSWTVFFIAYSQIICFAFSYFFFFLIFHRNVFIFHKLTCFVISFPFWVYWDCCVRCCFLRVFPISPYIVFFISCPDILFPSSSACSPAFMRRHT